MGHSLSPGHPERSEGPLSGTAVAKLGHLTTISAAMTIVPEAHDKLLPTKVWHRSQSVDILPAQDRHVRFTSAGGAMSGDGEPSR